MVFHLNERNARGNRETLTLREGSQRERLTQTLVQRPKGADMADMVFHLNEQNARGNRMALTLSERAVKEKVSPRPWSKDPRGQTMREAEHPSEVASVWPMTKPSIHARKRVCGQ
jgi:hypothetical protein